MEVELDHGDTGIVLAGDDAPVRSPKPWAALLPSLDPTTMGWAERAWYLGPHKSALFDRAGNAGPTVWWDGRIVGGWTQRADGEIVWRALDDVGRDGQRASSGRSSGSTPGSPAPSSSHASRRRSTRSSADSAVCLDRHITHWVC